jgi:hypothetical protein
MGQHKHPELYPKEERDGAWKREPTSGVRNRAVVDTMHNFLMRGWSAFERQSPTASEDNYDPNSTMSEGNNAEAV